MRSISTATRLTIWVCTAFKPGIAGHHGPYCSNRRKKTLCGTCKGRQWPEALFWKHGVNSSFRRLWSVLDDLRHVAHRARRRPWATPASTPAHHKAQLPCMAGCAGCNQADRRTLCALYLDFAVWPERWRISATRRMSWRSRESVVAAA